MKTKILLSTFSLFFIYVIACLIRPPQISDSLIVLSLAAFCGALYYFYINEKSLPPAPVLTKEQLDLEKLRTEKEIAALNYDIGKLNSAQISLKGAVNEKKTFIF